MNVLRREYLSRAGTGTALVFGGIGTAAAASNEEVLRAELVVVDRDPSAGAEVTVECDGRGVLVDGVIRVSDSCQTAALGDVRFDDGTLTVVVEETPRERRGAPCRQVVVGVDYVAKIALSEAPDTVVVVHRGVDETRAVHECGAVLG